MQGRLVICIIKNAYKYHSLYGQTKGYAGTQCGNTSEGSLKADVAVCASSVDSEGASRANPRLRRHIPNTVGMAID